MKTTSIVQIVSGFQPDVDGMGDFSRRLGASLWSEHAINSHFVVYRLPLKTGEASLIAPNTISYPPAATPMELLTHIRKVMATRNCGTILLHYGPYAYSQKGTPADFVNAIQSGADKINLIVYFHELYASAKLPWRRAFWTRREQVACVHKLMTNAKVCITSNGEYVSKLEKMDVSGPPVLKIPVFSNIGEPEFLKPLTLRARRLVIFGLHGNRMRLYDNYRDRIIETCGSLGINSIADVGSGEIASIPRRIGQIPVQHFGWLDDDQLSAVLTDSIAGMIGYWPDVWEKSGVIAAYQAHAMIPVLIPLESRRSTAPTFVPYLLADDVNVSSSKTRMSDADMQSRADVAHRYYMKNQSVTRCAEAIVPFLI